MEENNTIPVTDGPNRREEERIEALLGRVGRRAPNEAAEVLGEEPNETIAEVLSRINPSTALKILMIFKEDRRQLVIDKAPPERSEQWKTNAKYPEGSVGRCMELPTGVFKPDVTVGEAVEQLREYVKRAFITYCYITDDDGKLQGLVVMRDMLLARRDQRLDEIMLREPFYLTPEMTVADAMRKVLGRHYPVYPICDDKERLIGLMRGSTLAEQEIFELSIQAGSMVGVEREERLRTPWLRCLKLRYPWLQLNLLTAFVAAVVVGVFQATIDQIVVLAAFLPVLAGQSGNTGCQSLAVTLRGMTLGELRPGREKLLIAKEAFLGLLNGALVGAVAAAGMYVYAAMQDNPAALILGLVVFAAMVGSCIVSGVSGALVPIGLKKLGADPATASSIFLTTATDVVSMGLLLYLATWLVL